MSYFFGKKSPIEIKVVKDFQTQSVLGQFPIVSKVKGYFLQLSCTENKSCYYKMSFSFLNSRPIATIILESFFAPERFGYVILSIYKIESPNNPTQLFKSK